MKKLFFDIIYNFLKVIPIEFLMIDVPRKRLKKIGVNLKQPPLLLWLKRRFWGL